MSVAKIHEMTIIDKLSLRDAPCWFWYAICRPLMLSTSYIEVEYETCDYGCSVYFTQWIYKWQPEDEITQKVSGWDIVNAALMSLW